MNKPTAFLLTIAAVMLIGVGASAQTTTDSTTVEPEGVEVSVSDLDADPTAYDGLEVIITGEIIGDYGDRGHVVWFQVNDDPYAEKPIPAGGALRGTNVGVGVRLPGQLFDPSWGEPGGYRYRGPIVRIVGTFRHNAPDQFGETFIDGTSVELISPAVQNPIFLESRIPGLVGALLILIGGGLFARSRWLRANTN